MLILLFLALLFLGFYLAAVESVFLYLETARIEKCQEEGRFEAGFLKNKFLKNPGWFLANLKLSRLIILLLLARLLFHLIEKFSVILNYNRNILEIIAFFALIIVIHFFVFEVLGKSYGLAKEEKIFPWAVRGLKVTSFLLGPLVLMINRGALIFPEVGQKLEKNSFIFKKETKFLGVPLGESWPEEEKKKMLSSVYEFGKKMVKNVMTPRTQMVCLEAQSLPEEILASVRGGYSRVPVYEGEIDNILGVLYVKDLFKTEFLKTPIKLAEILRPAHFVPETKRVDKLLKEMRQTQNHLALVVDEFGGVAGLVTIEDLIEEIVGEIKDEYDEEDQLFFKLDKPGVYHFSGEVPVGKVNKILNACLSEKSYDTIGGFLLGAFGRIPQTSEAIKIENYTFMVEEVEDRRIKRIKVVKND